MRRQFTARRADLLSYFTRHKTAANLLLLVLVVAGLAAMPRMRAQFFPDVVIDNITVSVVWQGAGAEDVDTAIVQVLEPALLGVEGVAESSATSREGSARIMLEFEPDWDMSRAEDDVKTAVDTITTLPEEAEEPKIKRGAWRDRVTDLVITGPVGLTQLGLLADEVVARLFQIGVTRTTIQGVVAPETVIEISSEMLLRHDITLAAIAATVAAEVVTTPAGDVDGSNTRVRTGMARREAQDIANIVLRSQQDGTYLTLGDIAALHVKGIDRETSYFVENDPAITIRVDRSAAGDAIGIQKQVEELAERLSPTLPDGVSVELIRTRAEYISGRLQILLDNAVTGLALVVILLFLFLNARTAFWVAAGIPTALCAAIGLMYLSGITINMISLFALIITLGIVVDDAIVVGEHADARARWGEEPFEAAENAARRMALPVLSSTLTTIIAFFGLTAISGRFGDLLADLPITVILVLTASIIECFLILPNHMAHSLRASVQNAWYDLPSRIVNRGFAWARDHIFRPFIAGVIYARYLVLAGICVALISQVALVIAGDIPWRFFNAPERSSITGNFAMLSGASRADTEAMMREMQRATEALGEEYDEKYGVNPLDYVIAQIGSNAGRGLAGTDTKDADLLGGISIELIDPELRDYSSFAFLGDLQDRMTRLPLVETVSFRGWRAGPGGDALDIQFSGASAQVLKAASEALKLRMVQYPEVSAVEDNLAYDKDELVLNLTPQGQALGFTIDDLGRVLRHRLNGIEAARYPVGPRSASIRVEIPKSELTADFLERMRLRSANGVYVPLGDLVSVARRTGFSSVLRENGIRVVSVTGDISEDDAPRAAKIEEELQTLILPEIAERFQVDWRYAGLAEQESRFLDDAKLGLILALLGIYLVLAWVFSSWSRPLVVMAVIPFGLTGAIYGHALEDVPLSMFTVVGLLGMTGIIINDSIVLISTIDEYSERRARMVAVIEATCDRLRPVLLTTLTTVLGLAPLLWEKSSQAQFLKPTVITLVYGLGFGLVLVLMIVPALIAIQSDFERPALNLRRALSWPVPAARNVVRLSAGLICLLFGSTFGAVILQDGFWLADYIAPWVTLPESDIIAASLSFLIGACVISILTLVVFARTHNLSLKSHRLS